MAVRAGLPSYNLSVCFADSSPSRGASGETVHFAGTAKASPREGRWQRVSADGEVVSSSGSRSGFLSYNLSVCFADSSPSRGASGEEAKFYEMLRPSLGRSNSSKRNPTPAHSTIKQKRRRRLSNRQRRFAYSINSRSLIRPWPRCCALPSCRRRRSGTRCSGPERSAGQPG